MRRFDRLIPYLNAAVIAGISGWWLLYFTWESAARRLVSEDHVAEWGQVVLLGGAALCCALIVAGFGREYTSARIRAGFGLCCALLLLGAMEEISWGQRLLGLSTPELLRGVNVQDELNLHNLPLVHRLRHWLLIGFGTAGLLLIHVGARMGAEMRRAFQPGRELALLFWLVVASGIFREVGELVAEGEVGLGWEIRRASGRFSEVGELLAAATACLFAVAKLSEMREGLWRSEELVSRQGLEPRT